MIYTDLKQIFADIRATPLLIRGNLIAILLAICFGISTHTTRAESFSLSIYPPLLEIMMKPGKTITQVYLIANGGDDILLTPKILPFVPADEKGHVVFSSINNQQSTIDNYFSIKTPNISLNSPFLLKSGQTKEITLEINIPNDVEEKDNYFTFLFTSENQLPTAKSASRQAGSIGANLLLTVSESGTPVLHGKVVEFKILNSRFQILDSFTPPQYLLRIQNTGKSAFKPFGKITVEGALGDKWSYDLWPDNILVNSIREIRTASPSASAFLLGPYTASANFYLNEAKDGAEVSAKFTFIALPIKAVGVLLTTLILILIVGKLASKKTPKNKITK